MIKATITNEELLAKTINVIADELSKARAQNAQLREALEPFAEAAKHWEDRFPGCITHDNVELWQRGKRVDYLTCGDLRKAKAALAETPAESLEAVRAEAGRDRAVRELEELYEELKTEALNFEKPSEDPATFGATLIASAIGLCRVKIGRRLEDITKEGKK